MISGNITAQNPVSLSYEPEVQVNFSTFKDWSHSFGVSNRNSFFTYYDGERIASAAQEHLEFNHFTTHQLNPNTSLALGLRYRFKDIFEAGEHNEFRSIQEFQYEQPSTLLNLSHRIRFEQRFREVTSYRGRYQLGISRPISENFTAGLDTEFLWSMASGTKPEAEQRFSLELENSSFEKLDLSIGIDYRFDNFNNATQEEIFILTGIDINLD